MYGLQMMACLGAFYALLLVEEKRSFSRLVFLVIASLAAVYTHYFSILVIGPLLAYLAVSSFIGDNGGERKITAAAILAVTALCLPLLFLIAGQSGAVGENRMEMIDPSTSMGSTLIQSCRIFLAGFFGDGVLPVLSPAITWVSIFTFAGSIAGPFLLTGRNSKVLSVYFTGSLLAFFIVAWFWRMFFIPAHLSVLLPGVALGGAALWASYKRSGTILVTATVAAGVIGTAGLLTQPNHDSWRKTVEAIDRDFREGDLVSFYSPYYAAYLAHYSKRKPAEVIYFPKLLGDAGAGSDHAVEILRDKRGVRRIRHVITVDAGRWDPDGRVLKMLDRDCIVLMKQGDALPRLILFQVKTREKP